MNNIRREMLPGDVCVLTFDRPNSAANIFDQATLRELIAHLGEVQGARGLILASAKDGIFVAGADLHSIKTMSAADLREFIQLGQTAFNQLAALPIPTVAAIHGVAVGGGYEVGLACDWRVASSDRATKVGLPETKLGIIPAWGGSTRLPRLIGVPRALDLILGGKTVTAKHALKLGLVDDLAPREYLISAARRLLGKGKHPKSLSHSPAMNALVDAVIARKVRADVQKKTHGHYPAVQKALEVVLAGASSWREEESFARERQAVDELIGLDSTKNLLRIFFLQERAKKLSALPKDVSGEKPRRSPAIQTAAVIGAGIMGAGIAQWLSARGLRVILRDVDADRVAAGMANVSRLYSDAVKHRLFTPVEARAGIERISPAPSEVSLRHTGIVIEAAVEKMEIKKKIFQRLDELTSEETILATNTSALSISELAAATKHPARVVGVHFFNPVHKMQLVEVITGRDTSPEAADAVLRLVQRIGKLPVLVKDSPGFLVNRILLPYMIEAGSLFEAGAAIEEIDRAMIEFGMPMGPLRLIDEVGVDISEDVAVTLANAFPDRLHVPEALTRMISGGLLGRKSGKGFYLHSKGGDAVPNPAVGGFTSGTMRSAAGLSRAELQKRMVLLMVNESARCLEEQIVASPADVDFGMVMGTGWAPFRGGPLRHADSIGVAHVVDELSELADTAGPHYAPCAMLKERQRKPFYED